MGTPLTLGGAALVTFYAELGRRMGVPDLPRDYAGLAAYLERCEAGFAYTPAGRVCSDRTLAMARARVRPWLRPLVGPVIATLLAPATRAAVGLRTPPAPARALVLAALRVRRGVVRRLPPRAVPITPRTRRGSAGADDVAVHGAAR
ncbi:oxygenase MpaB family protein [Dactylosporangium sp. NPDC048998]|uniref:oxygenase MpaB family protein n=1 Tax=Dactylosporangium sp. NPDC048998 TaxID=3363976 RepID=UPI00371B30C8